MPIKLGKGRQQTVSVGPVGILVMLCLWYPLVLIIQVSVALVWWLGAVSVRLVAAACRGTARARQARPEVTP